MRVIEQICNRVAVIDQSHIVELGEVQEVFVHPQSAIARQLIFPQGQAVDCSGGTKGLRLVFDGTAAFEPVVAQMVLECRVLVNILYAHTKTVEGKTFGQMVLQLPEDPEAVVRMKEYLTAHGIYCKEEPLNE